LSPWDALVLGGGGAGLMAAIAAGRRGRKVLVVDHRREPGAKILVSGGGRCNFTNRFASAEHYVSRNPHFAKSALARFGPADFLAMVERHGIPYHEKKLGQLFCDRSARDILSMLLEECGQVGVGFLLGRSVASVEKRDGAFRLDMGGDTVEAASLVVATGGLSFPKLGATELGYKIARQFGMNVLPRSAALDGFVLAKAERDALAGLSGVSAEVTLACGKASFRESLLVTHLGLSGPAALQASLYWEPGMELRASFEGPLPKRLAQRFKSLGWDGADWRFVPEGTVGYAKAEVTRGGVDTDGLSSKTMQALKVPGLYFVGEVVDVTGELGGYNFQWAWSSGYAAGSAL
jgi:predicted Rossmann fold flavoprotein